MPLLQQHRNTFDCVIYKLLYLLTPLLLLRIAVAVMLCKVCTNRSVSSVVVLVVVAVLVWCCRAEQCGAACSSTQVTHQVVSLV